MLPWPIAGMPSSALTLALVAVRLLSLTINTACLSAGRTREKMAAQLAINFQPADNMTGEKR
jgi:hypothetical protein